MDEMSTTQSSSSSSSKNDIQHTIATTILSLIDTTTTTTTTKYKANSDDDDDDESFMMTDDMDGNNDNDITKLLQQATICNKLSTLINQYDNSIVAEDNGSINTNTVSHLSTCTTNLPSLRTIFNKVPITIQSSNNNYNTNTSTINIRQCIIQILNTLLNNRLTINDVLPLTMDTVTNNEITNNPTMYSITLTLSCLYSLQLYCILLYHPGSLSYFTNLLQLDTINTLYNIIQRWTIELCHREKLIWNSNTNNNSNSNSNNKKHSKTKQHSSSQNTDNNESSTDTDEEQQDDDNDDDDVYQKPKRSKGQQRTTTIKMKTHTKSKNQKSTTKSNEKQFGSIVFDDEDTSISNTLQPTELFYHGLIACTYLVQIPLQKEFTDWSYDVQEIILKSITHVVSTCHALLVSVPSLSSSSNQQQQHDLPTLVRQIITNGSYALAHCIFIPYNSNKLECQNNTLANDDEIDANDYEDNNNNNNTTRQQTLVWKRNDIVKNILRSLITYITFDETVPNGDIGKMIAATNTFTIVEEIIRLCTNEIQQDINGDWKLYFPQLSSSSLSLSSGTTPKGRTSVGSVMTPLAQSNNARTPTTTNRATDRRRRRSNGGTIMMSPKLKSTNKKKNNKTKSTTTIITPTSTTKQKIIPIISILIGFIQRILSITTGRERVVNRTFIVTGVINCIRVLPTIQQQLHIIKFIQQLCQSKLSIHRLIGCEIISLLLLEDWLWNSNSNNNNDENDSNNKLKLIDNQNTPTTPGLNSIATTNANQSIASSSLSSTNRIRFADCDNVDSQHDVFSPSSLIVTLQGRLSDRYPTIRTASATAISNVLRRVTEEYSGSHNKNDDSTTETTPIGLRRLGSALSSQCYEMLELLRRRILHDDKATVRRSCINAYVELLVLCEMMNDSNNNNPVLSISISETDIVLLCDLCTDIGVYTRRTAADGLTRLLELVVDANNPDRIDIIYTLERAWSLAILPMVLDTETSCSNKVVELFERIILEPVLLPQNTNDTKQQCAWRILSSCAGCTSSSTSTGSDGVNDSDALRVALSKTIILSIKSSGTVALASKVFKQIYVVANKSLDSNQPSENMFNDSVVAQRTGVWCLFEAAIGYSTNLSEVKAAIKHSKIDLDFLTISWETMVQLFETPNLAREYKMTLQRTMQNCLKVLSTLADMVDSSLTVKTADGLQRMISDLSSPPEIIGSAIAALIASIVSYSNAHGEDENQNCIACIKSLYTSCENAICTNSNDLASCTAIPIISKALYTIGELSLVGFKSDEDSNNENGSNENENIYTTSDINTLDVVGLMCLPNQKLIDFVQAFMAQSLPGTDSVPTPTSIRAHAFVAIGKLCLRNESLAQSTLTILARELHPSNKDSCQNPAIQSNALLIMGDLCIRYTNLVDRFLPVMAACLQLGVSDLSSVNALSTASYSNVSSLVRKHSIMVLSNLILQDYIKWRGLLFHRFLVACADEDEEVSNLAETVLVGPLLGKQPRLFSNQFVESFFVLNRCTAHPIYMAAASMGDGGSGISVGFDGINLSGNAGRPRRMKMYYLMLSKMTDEEKIGVTARIGKDILDGALKGTGDLSLVCRTANVPDFETIESVGPSGNTDDKAHRQESARNVLADALAILASPNIRVGKVSSNRDTVDDDIVDDNDASAAITNNRKVVQLAKGRLLSNVSRKHMIDTLLPILCNLKVVLQKNASTLLRDLMLCLVEYYTLYKDEVKECLASDPTLLQELDYDSKQYAKDNNNKSKKSNVINTTTRKTNNDGESLIQP